MGQAVALATKARYSSSASAPATTVGCSRNFSSQISRTRVELSRINNGTLAISRSCLAPPAVPGGKASD
eukprot:CAMPEP_0171126898 /NCGR_PEP_ID=MMETSP0766_2-20121228/114242_1 /TAXON_ID=439317 /ORGANISM="Gambierdiscus australes, Strain CAWD 149" /LENGTH=68 /DNA_ID=CAMNT_0011589967 /DNA_START=354 /DNA_END=557 /DNA_ORIENTATION=+